MAGGRSSRFGRDKALLMVDGETLLERTVRRVRAVTAEQLVIGPPERGEFADGARVVVDQLPGSGPLGGILTSLRAARHDRVLVVACDMPLLNVNLLAYLLSLSEGVEVVLPRLDGRGQQLHAVYSRSCIEPIERQIQSGDYKIDRFFRQVRVREVEDDELRQYDPALSSFQNVNTEADWAAVRSLLTS